MSRRAELLLLAALAVIPVVLGAMGCQTTRIRASATRSAPTIQSPARRLPSIDALREGTAPSALGSLPGNGSGKAARNSAAV